VQEKVKKIVIICLIVFCFEGLHAQFHYGGRRIWFSLVGGIGTPQQSGSEIISPRYGFLAGVSFAFNPFGKIDLQSGINYFKSVRDEKIVGNLAEPTKLDPKFNVTWFSQDIMYAFAESNRNVTYGLLGFGAYRVEFTERQVDNPPEATTITQNDVTKDSFGLSIGFGNRFASFISGADIVLDMRYHYLLSIKPTPKFSTITVGVMF